MALVPQRAVASIPCGLWNLVGKALKGQDSKSAHFLGDLEPSNAPLGSGRWVALPLSNSKEYILPSLPASPKPRFPRPVSGGPKSALS